MPSIRRFFPKKWREWWVKRELLKESLRALDEACLKHQEHYKSVFDERETKEQWVQRTTRLLELYCVTVYWQVYSIRVRESPYWGKERDHRVELPRITAVVWELQRQSRRIWAEESDREDMMPAIIKHLAKIVADKDIICARVSA